MQQLDARSAAVDDNLDPDRRVLQLHASTRPRQIRPGGPGLPLVTLAADGEEPAQRAAHRRLMTSIIELSVATSRPAIGSTRSP
ncbi:MAG: hypothetical protein U0353_19915 [Sandaracinus sp.]